MSRIFHRSRSWGQDSIEQSCPDCFASPNSYTPNTTWTAGQAQKNLRVKELKWEIESCCNPDRGESKRTGQFCGPLPLYSDLTVSRAAVEKAGGVWELHHCLALYEKRRRT